MGITPDRNYSTEQVGDLTKFTYTKSPVNLRIIFSLCLYTAIPAIFIAARVSPFANSLVMGIVVWLIVMFLLNVFATIIISRSRSKPEEFLVSKKEIVVDGKTYDQEEVSDYSIVTLQYY